MDGAESDDLRVGIALGLFAARRDAELGARDDLVLEHKANAAQIAHARGCSTFLPNWNGPVGKPALILIVGTGVHLRSNGIDGSTTRIVTTVCARLDVAFICVDATVRELVPVSMHFSISLYDPTAARLRPSIEPGGQGEFIAV